MKTAFQASLLLSFCFSLSACLDASAQRVSADGAMQTFDVLQNQFFDEVYFPFAPTQGTAAGLHQYDARLEDYSAAGVAKEVAALHRWQAKVEAVPANGLDAPVAADREILLTRSGRGCCRWR